MCFPASLDLSRQTSFVENRPISRLMHQFIGSAFIFKKEGRYKDHLSDFWTTRTISIKQIDVVCLVKKIEEKEETKNRWILIAHDSNETVSEIVNNKQYEYVLAASQSSGIFVPYHRVDLEKIKLVYEAVLTHLEDRSGAEEIIEWGKGMGGAIQELVWKDRLPKEGIKYIHVIFDCFSKLSKTKMPPLNFLIKTSGWNIDVLAHSRRQDKIQEIIIQSEGSVRKRVTLKEEVSKPSLAFHLLEKEGEESDRIFFVIPKGYSDADLIPIIREINRCFTLQYEVDESNFQRMRLESDETCLVSYKEDEEDLITETARIL